MSVGCEGFEGSAIQDAGVKRELELAIFAYSCSTRVDYWAVLATPTIYARVSLITSYGPSEEKLQRPWPLRRLWLLRPCFPHRRTLTAFSSKQTLEISAN